MLKTFTANAKHSIRNNENVSIGGGEFNAQEMTVVLDDIDVLVGLLRSSLETYIPENSILASSIKNVIAAIE